MNSCWDYTSFYQSKWCHTMMQSCRRSYVRRMEIKHDDREKSRFVWQPELFQFLSRGTDFSNGFVNLSVSLSVSQSVTPFSTFVKYVFVTRCISLLLTHLFQFQKRKWGWPTLCEVNKVYIISSFLFSFLNFESQRFQNMIFRTFFTKSWNSILN